jgi:hypothetical protein
MNCIGYHVTEVVKIEGAIVRNDCNVFADCEPGCGDFFPRIGWVVSESIESSSDADVPSTLRGIGEKIPLEPAGARLSGCKVAVLF